MLAVSMVNVPPCGMASRLFTARFSSTCSMRPENAIHGAQIAGQVKLRLDFFTQQAPNHGAQAVHHLIQIDDLGRGTRRRLNSNRRLVSSPARSAAFTICSAKCRLGSFSPSF